MNPTQEEDSGVVAVDDPSAADAAWLSGAVPAKTRAELPAEAPANVAKGNGVSESKPSPASPDSSGEGQHPSPRTEDAAVSLQDQSQPAAASQHTNQPTAISQQPSAAACQLTSQPTAASMSQLIPAPESRPATPQSHVPNNDAQAQVVSGNISRETDSAPAMPITVQSARVLEHMGQTEMRVGVNTADFGNVELSASVSQDRVGASITTTHLDLRAAMMAEMPSLQRAMEQHQLRLDQLDLSAQTGSQDRGASAHEQPRSQSGVQSGFRSSQSRDAAPSQESSAPSSWIAPHSSGLNVHA